MAIPNVREEHCSMKRRMLHLLQCKRTSFILFTACTAGLLYHFNWVLIDCLLCMPMKSGFLHHRQPRGGFCSSNCKLLSDPHQNFPSFSPLIFLCSVSNKHAQLCLLSPKVRHKNAHINLLVKSSKKRQNSSKEHVCTKFNVC